MGPRRREGRVRVEKKTKKEGEEEKSRYGDKKTMENIRESGLTANTASIAASAVTTTAATSTSKALSIPFTNDKSIHAILSHPSTLTDSSPPSLIFTHGAGGTLSAPAVVHFSGGFSSISSLLCFQGSMNLGSRVKMFGKCLEWVTEKEWEDGEGEGGERVVGAHAAGGRSMGARAAIMAVSGSGSPDGGMRAGVKRFVLISYPLLDGKGGREGILLDLPSDTEVLFIIGSKDGMCDLKRLNAVRAKMKARTWLVVVAGAGHGMDVSGHAKGKKALVTKEIGNSTGRIAAHWLKDREGDESFETAEDAKKGYAKTEGSIFWDNESREGEGDAIWSGWTSGTGFETSPDTTGNQTDEKYDQSSKVKPVSSDSKKRKAVPSQDGDIAGESSGKPRTRSSKRRR